jgi:hypothetical protein
LQPTLLVGPLFPVLQNGLCGCGILEQENVQVWNYDSVVASWLIKVFIF